MPLDAKGCVGESPSGRAQQGHAGQQLVGRHPTDERLRLGKQQAIAKRRRTCRIAIVVAHVAVEVLIAIVALVGRVCGQHAPQMPDSFSRQRA
jgi:hypothetical protein